MSKSTKIKLLIILAAICCTAALFAGCAGELKANSFLEQNNAIGQQVTYYSNGGHFGDKDSVKEKNIYYHVNDVILTNFDSVTNAKMAVVRDEYVFNGWYYAELTDKLDEKGNPELDVNGNRIQVPVFEDKDNKIVKATSIPLEEGKKMEANTHLYVCASWRDAVKLQIKLVADTPLTLKVDGEEKEVKPNELITEMKFSYGGVMLSEQVFEPVKGDATFLQYYTDAECTNPAADLIQQPEADVEEVIYYAKYITGKWTVVKAVDDARRMFNNLHTSTQYYVLKDIDCSSLELRPKDGSGNTNCIIEGDGHTLKNIKVANALNGLSAGGVYSIFGNLGVNAKIKNLTLDGVTLTYTTRVTLQGLYFFCSGDNGATLENFNIKNVKMVVNQSEGATVMNIQNVGGVYTSDSWLFGCVDKDEEYTKVAEGQLTIDGLKLTVGDTDVVNLPASAEAQN